jgi:hypothetical protein
LIFGSDRSSRCRLALRRPRPESVRLSISVSFRANCLKIGVWVHSIVLWPGDCPLFLSFDPLSSSSSTDSSLIGLKYLPPRTSFKTLSPYLSVFEYTGRSFNLKGFGFFGTNWCSPAIWKLNLAGENFVVLGECI